MHRIAETHLYHTVYATFEVSKDPWSSSAANLLRTLGRHPHLQAHVKVIKGRFSNPEASRFDDFDDLDDFYDKTDREAQVDAAMHDILALLPRLEALDMKNFTSMPDELPAWADMLMTNSAGCPLGCNVEQHGFSHLQRVDGLCTRSPFLHLRPLFDLPSIRSINLRSCQTDSYGEISDGQLQEWSKLTSSVTHLSFEDVVVAEMVASAPRDFELVARACPNLQSFRFVGIDQWYGSYFLQAILKVFANPTNTQLSKVEIWVELECFADAVCLNPHLLDGVLCGEHTQDLDLNFQILHDFAGT